MNDVGSFLTLECEGFRNLATQPFRFFHGINVISGQNASGKTSVLEAVYLLGHGRSFRTNALQNLIRTEQPFFRVIGRIFLGGVTTRVGVERTRSKLSIRLDGRDCQTRVELAQRMPLQVLSTETQRILQDGPDARRKLLNWGCFHNHKGFSRVWNRYERALKQRNAAIRSGNRRLVVAWEGDLADSGSELESLRGEYLEHYLPLAQLYLDTWLGRDAVTIRYRRGWDIGTSFADTLSALRERDQELGFTTRGPHRADLTVQAYGIQAQQSLSRGQQKLVGIALVLAQLRHLAEQRQRRPVVLVDDLLAELDKEAAAMVVRDLQACLATVLLTVIDPDDLPDGIRDVTHSHYQLKDGVAREVVSCT